jgi:hypothetical protein
MRTVFCRRKQHGNSWWWRGRERSGIPIDTRADTVTVEANRSVVCRDSRKRNQRAKEKSARE